MEKKEFEKHLTENIIPFWNRLRDDEMGGFYGYVDGNCEIDKKADKGVILNSRILWFYSSAYLLLKDEKLLSMADHAYGFLKEHCIDRQYGGIYWSLHYDGTPSDETKHTYNHAFAIYALSTYYMAGGNKEALKLAYDLYDIIENKCSDEGGYLEAFSRDFSPAENDKLSENGVIAGRTMNTLLHVFESYTALYEADRDEKVKELLKKALMDFKNKIYNPSRKISDVFFDENYNSIIDLESYGHDIEAAWLIDRACEVLGDEATSGELKPVIEGLAESAYNNGMDFSLNAMNNECENGVVDTKKVWWVQAESVVGFYNAYQNDASREEYLKNAENIWSFILRYVVDKDSGEWIENIYDVNSIDKSQALAHPWKCPYHNGRMCIEMIKRLA